MNISEMSDQEKSVMLARVWGWRIDNIGFGKQLVNPDCDGSLSTSVDSLYDPANMTLAWLVLNWLALNDDLRHTFYGFWDNGDLWQLPPAEAQRTWLDKVLELAIDAGLVAPQEQAGKEEGGDMSDVLNDLWAAGAGLSKDTAEIIVKLRDELDRCNAHLGNCQDIGNHAGMVNEELKAELAALRKRLKEAEAVMSGLLKVVDAAADVREIDGSNAPVRTWREAHAKLYGALDVAVTLLAAAWLAAAPQEEEKVCEWKHEDSEWTPENWETSCFSTFPIDNAKPGMLFCPYCGGKIVVNREEEAR